jgi:hypothetical protein
VACGSGAGCGRAQLPGSVSGWIVGSRGPSPGPNGPTD